MTHDPQVQQIDPRTLLIDTNIRRATTADTHLVESICDLGVLQPVVAVRTATGDLRVRYGHRRTLASIEAGLDTIPVYVAADERTDDEAQIERLVAQHDENERRAGLSTSERAGVASQLAAFGVSAIQIARRTRMPRAHVEAALVVSASALASAAADRYDFLDLTQAAAVAEFEDDGEAVKALVAAASRGQFDHVLQRLRDERSDAAHRQATAEALAAQGITVVPRPEPGGTTTRLDNLLDAEGEPLGQGHATCPGHAAFITSTWGYAPEQDDEDHQDGDEETATQTPEPARVRGAAPVFVCTDPTAHGHRSRYGQTSATPKARQADLDPEAQAAATAERRDVIESNKAWRSAETVRREWLRTFLTRKSTPKGSAAFIALALGRDGEVITRVGANHLAAALLGCEDTGYGRNQALTALVERCSETRAQVLTLAQVLAGYEDAALKDSWRYVERSTSGYLVFLAACGYTLSPIERRACGLPPQDEAESSGEATDVSPEQAAEAGS